MEKREGNYDLLRIISAVAVIMIHVSARWFGYAIDTIAQGLSMQDIVSPFWLCIYNSVSRFAVPCFVMLSGAFILDNERNAEYRNFYSKSFSKIGVPTIVFSILYVLYQIPSYFWGGINGLASLAKRIIEGNPMYHMWYMYMLIVLYILAPVVIRFKNSISEKNFYKISLVFLAFASISMWTGSPRLAWDVGGSFEYLGYFMIGYSIRKSSRKNNGKAVLAGSAGILLEVCAAGLEYLQMAAGIAEDELKYTIVGPSNPLIVLASVLIFYGFTVLDIKKDVAKLSSMTFWIYLIHAGVWDFITKAAAKRGYILVKSDGMVWIPVWVAVVFVISWILSKLYIWLWGIIDKEKRLTNMMLRIAHL